MNKTEVFQCCLGIVEGKLRSLKSLMNELQESANNETKSSAGDKHETARAMVQNEMEQVSRQMHQFREMQAILDRIDPEHQSAKAGLGSIVETETAFYFIAVSLGKMEVGDLTVLAISPQSPMGKLLSGKSAGDTIQFSGSFTQVLRVF